MEIQILKNESDILREYPYGSRLIENSAGVSNKRRESSNRCRVARNTPALLSKGSARPDEQKAITPVKSLLLTKEDNDIVTLKKKIDLKDVFKSNQIFSFLNISTETVKDQYMIGKIAFDIPHQKINKYREAQACCLLQEPILEIFV
jgi:hypothetical protein